VDAVTEELLRLRKELPKGVLAFLVPRQDDLDDRDDLAIIMTHRDAIGLARVGRGLRLDPGDLSRPRRCIGDRDGTRALVSLGRDRYDVRLPAADAQVGECRESPRQQAAIQGAIDLDRPILVEVVETAG